MAKLTRFTISPTGQLVYRSTGKLAPSSYTFRKNTVYGSDGRRIGSLSRNLTKKEAAKIAKAERSRNKRLKAQGKRPPQPKKANRPKQDRPKRPKAPTQEDTQEYGTDWDQFDTTEFPEESEQIKEEFALRVRMAALSVAPPSLSAKIRALSTEAIWRAYLEDAYIFETYFEYHEGREQPRRSDISVWLYQFVHRIEQYM